ncbi:MAG: hypothetical protein NTW28_03880, partial [Candidatus Solibacter sp.]|nr:hypothetical protein [Candidatus Solibacter sp.]
MRESDTIRNSPGGAAPNPSQVRAQLERLLASPHLRNSRRCQSLLNFGVEAVLDGAPDRVKERTLGVQVFGREPEYDTNHDSVVRNAAIEVRKRLAQYYMEPGHEAEMRIALPQGGYVPEFQVPATLPNLPQADEPALPLPRQGRRVRLAVIAAVPCVVAAIWLLTPPAQTELDRFWTPLVDDRAGVLICVGQPARVYTFAGPKRAELDEKM